MKKGIRSFEAMRKNLCGGRKIYWPVVFLELSENLAWKPPYDIVRMHVMES